MVKLDTYGLRYPFHIRWSEEDKCYLGSPLGAFCQHYIDMPITHGDTLGEIYKMCGDLCIFMLEDMTELEQLQWHNVLKGAKLAPDMHVAMIQPRIYCLEHDAFDNECDGKGHDYDNLEDVEVDYEIIPFDKEWYMNLSKHFKDEETPK